MLIFFSFFSFLSIFETKKSVFLLSFLIFKKVLLVPSAQWTGCIVIVIVIVIVTVVIVTVVMVTVVIVTVVIVTVMMVVSDSSDGSNCDTKLKLKL